MLWQGGEEIVTCIVALKYFCTEVAIGQDKPCSHASLQGARETQLYYVRRRRSPRNRWVDSPHYCHGSTSFLCTVTKAIFLMLQSDIFSCLNLWREDGGISVNLEIINNMYTFQRHLRLILNNKI